VVKIGFWTDMYPCFCAKYHHEESHRESLSRFIEKLKEKKQVEEKRKQASQAVAIFYELENRDELVKSRKMPFPIIPVKAIPEGSSRGVGVPSFQEFLDSRLRGSDDNGDFLRSRQPWSG